MDTGAAPAEQGCLALEGELEDQFLAVDLIDLLADMPKAKFGQDRNRRAIARCHTGEDFPFAVVSCPLDQPLGCFGGVASCAEFLKGGVADLGAPNGFRRSMESAVADDGRILL